MASLAALEAWMEGVGITWNRDLIRLVDSSAGCSGLALGIQAVKDVPEGASLCEIPKAACISTRTSPIADIIEREGLGGGLGLVLAVLHEMALGEDSEWAGYLKAMPSREYLPIFWSDEELQLLQGTEAEEKAALDREHMQEDFETHVLPLLEAYPGRLRSEAITLGNFRVAASYVASRAFGIDDFHGDAMVPLADIFNHKASVVELAPGYSVHGAESSEEEEEGAEDAEGEEGEGVESGASEEEGGEEEEGAPSGRGGEEHAGAANGACAAGCGHTHHRHHHTSPSHRHAANRTAAAADAAAGSAGGEEEGKPHAAAGAAAGSGTGIMSSSGAGGKAHDIHGITSANGLHLRLEIAILDKEDHLEIVAASAVPQGHEVHNTYGEKCNSDLLSKYGFALRDNPFTAVSLDKEVLLGAARGALGARAFRTRCRFLEEETEVLDPEEEPFEVLPNGHVSPALFVALRVLGAEEGEAKLWGGISEALALQPLPGASSTAAAAAGEEEEGDEDCAVPPVQVWAVRGEAAGGHGMAGNAAVESGVEAAAADGPERPQPTASAAEAAGQQQQQPGSGPAEGTGGDGGSRGPSRGARLSALLSPPACTVLRHAVVARLARYSGTLDDDLAWWQRVQQTQQGGALLSEHDAAVAAALLLRLSEKEALHEMLHALELRGRQLEAHAQQAQQQAGAAKAGGKGRKRGRQQQPAAEGEQPTAKAAQQQGLGGRGKRARAAKAEPPAQKAGKTKQGGKGSGTKPAGTRRKKSAAA